MTYATDRLFEEVAYVAYHFHWPMDTILDLEHPLRLRFVEEIGRINKRLIRGGVTPVRLPWPFGRRTPSDGPCQAAQAAPEAARRDGRPCRRPPCPRTPHRRLGDAAADPAHRRRAAGGRAGRAVP